MTTSTENIKGQIQALNDIAAKVDPTDLCQLAKMHECAQQIEKQCANLPETIDSLLLTICQWIAQSSENIILEEIADTQACLNQMRSVIKRLAEMQLDADCWADVDVLQELAGQLKGEDRGPKQQADEPSPAEEPSQADTQSKPTEQQPAGEEPPPAQAAGLEPVDYTSEPLLISDEELEYVKSFVDESQEHLEGIETSLLSVEQSPDDLDQINELFRLFHTIKGAAGFLNLKDVNMLTHMVESLLDLARKGKLRLTPAMIDVIFEALDVLKVQIKEISEYIAKPTGQAVPQPPIASLLERIHDVANGKPNEPPPGEKPQGQARQPIGEILVDEGRATPELVEFALQKQREGETKPIGELMTSMGAVKARDVDQALRKQKGIQATAIRVDTGKLDNLISTVGELVIAQSQVAQNEDIKPASKLGTLVEQVSKITREVQEISMSLRMVPIASTFQKMGRIARDIARKRNKQIDFVTDGEETELDKNIIQEISDPLMHMVRNAVDHGIESPDVRVQKGKPAKGTVKLNAFHQGGSIIIEVSDDGKGLDKDVLIQKGIEKGLIEPNAQLSDEQIYQLIMTPGFSTAESVTDVSGRGVGMDVVKRNIDKLRGKIEIQSVKDQGSTFTIRLPLTLAVIDAMIVRAGERKFIIPTLLIHQALVPTPQQIHTIQGKGKIINLRGQLHPVIALADAFGIAGAAKDPTQGIVVIVQAEDKKIGIVLDELLGQQQVVIKSLGHVFHKLRSISGGAILADGTVGLILEPAGLLDLCN